MHTDQTDINDLINNAILGLGMGAPLALHPLGGGSLAEVQYIRFENGKEVVIKYTETGSMMPEARMLAYLATHSQTPCPEVLYASPEILVMDYIANDNQISGPVAQHSLARCMANQHQKTNDCFGFPFDTVIGNLPQPNPHETNWVTFFGTHRLLFMGVLAYKNGQCSAKLLSKIEKLIPRLPDLIPSHPKPALLHGDLWGGNMLWRNDRLAALIDPALYYGHHEMDLAFGTLFGDLKPAFFEKYSELEQIDPDFFKYRRKLYNLYPILVHVCLFGGHYTKEADNILRHFGVE